MGIPLYKVESVNSGDCINCMRCISVCPRGNTAFTIAKKDVRPMMASATTIAIITGMYFTADLAVNSQESTAYSVDLAVNSQESTAYSMVSQSSVSNTSSVAASAPSISSVSSIPSVSSVSSAPSAASVTQNPSSVASTSQTASIVSSQAVSVVSSGYIDGTFQGSGRGFRGTTTVSVVLLAGKITTVKVISYQDDGKYFQQAYSKIPSAIITSQSAAVDAVSGATYSSNGIMAAVADALSKATA